VNAVVKTIVLMSLGLSTAAVLAEDDAGTPAEQYRALLKAYGPASGAMRKAESDQQRKAAVERLAAFAPEFVKLVEDNPEDPIALNVLRQAIQAVGSTDSAAQIAWETNRSDYPTTSAGESARRIVALLMRDHLQSDQLGPICDRMRYGYRLEFAPFLRAVMNENPDRNVQGVACLSLGQFLNDRLRMLQLTEQRPELAECYEIVFGKEYLPRLQRLGPAGLMKTEPTALAAGVEVGVNQSERPEASAYGSRKKAFSSARGQAALAKQVEILFEQALEKYADATIRSGVTVGARAKSELNDIRHLSVGKLALDIEGNDQNGGQFKLSDYRGKVVLLYFWSEY
jgi:hypothetical protein